MTEVVVRLRHLRKAGICMAGCRSFCAEQNWDWTQFIDRGLPASKLEGTRNAFALRVAKLAREEAENG